MLKIFPYRRRAKKRQNDKAISGKNTAQAQGISSAPDSPPLIKALNFTEEKSFAAHMAAFLGETVTIYVDGGALSGAGFTGVLIEANKTYISLIISFSSIPACPLGNACTPAPNCCFPAGCPYTARSGFRILFVPEAIAVIHTDDISAFVHNTL